jgi:hypothetical protein
MLDNSHPGAAPVRAAWHPVGCSQKDRRQAPFAGSLA